MLKNLRFGGCFGGLANVRRWLCVPECEALRILSIVEGLLCVPELRPERFLERGFVLCVLGLKSLIVWGLYSWL